MDWPESLIFANTTIYQHLAWSLTNFRREDESSEYDACRFVLDGKRIVFRASKITPKKVGQFVTLWQRPEHITSKNKKPLPTALSVHDNFDLVIVSTLEGKHAGQFIFDKDILGKKGILSDTQRRGKTAFRVYPPWAIPTAKDAIKTQKWQLDYFFAAKDSSDIS